MTTLDYEIRSSVGALLYTSPDLTLARRFFKERREDFPGCELFEVERFEVRRKIGGFAKLKVAA